MRNNTGVAAEISKRAAAGESYEPPTLTNLGSVADLTAAKLGQTADGLGQGLDDGRS